jgi:hypothetical protein
MKVGKKATGQESYAKYCVRRHGTRMTVRAANALEKAIETKVRQAGKREIRAEVCDGN